MLSLKIVLLALMFGVFFTVVETIAYRPKPRRTRFFSNMHSRWGFSTVEALWDLVTN